MAGLLEAAASLIVIAAVVKVLLAAMLGGLYEWRSWRFLVGMFRRPETTTTTTLTRSLSTIQAEARRISELFHHEGMRFAQYEGRRQAYDRILAEAATAMHLAHLLEVLPPGPERDRERGRIEESLIRAGVLPAPTSDGRSAGP